MKKIHFAFLGLTLLAGVVLFSAFSDKKVEEKSKHDLPTVYFRYLPSANDEGDFETPGSWDYIGTTNPGTGCGISGSNACIVELVEGENLSIDPSTQTHLEMEEAFAALLESFGDTDSRYDNASDFVAENVRNVKF